MALERSAIGWQQYISRALGCKPGQLTYQLEECIEKIEALRPRTVNSATELDALPDGSVILFEGMAWQACEFVSKTYPEGYICWVCHESWRGELGSADVIPATVLFTPGEAR